MLVKWEGSNPNGQPWEDSWEPRGNLKHAAKDPHLKAKIEQLISALDVHTDVQEMDSDCEDELVAALGVQPVQNVQTGTPPATHKAKRHCTGAHNTPASDEWSDSGSGGEMWQERMAAEDAEVVAHGPELAAGPVPRPSNNSESSGAPAGSSEHPHERLVLSALRPLFDRSLHGEVGRPNPLAQNYLTRNSSMCFACFCSTCSGANKVAEAEIAEHLAAVH